MNSIQTQLPAMLPLPTNNIAAGMHPEFASKLDSLKQDAIDAQAEKMGSEFESVFVSLMLKEMRNTLDGEQGLFGGEGSDTFGGMFDLFMGQHLAEASPLGIADAIKGFLENKPQDLSEDSESSPVDQAK